MVDLKFIRDNEAAVRANIRNRALVVDVDLVLSLDRRRIELISEVEELRKRRNDNAARMKGPMEQGERESHIEEGRVLKEQIAATGKLLEACETELFAEAARIPNMAHPDVPVGLEEEDNIELRQVGRCPEFDFPAKDHLAVSGQLDILDFETATGVSGPRFYYLKNEAVFLELALCRYALTLLQRRGYTPTITPDIARSEVVEGIGFNPRGEESNIYTIEGTESCLIGTAEITLGGMYRGEIIDSDTLPIRLAGLSHCFRREAGAAGQYSRGLYRVHQFTKVEMFVFCLPEDSEALHNELLEIEEEIFTGLGIPYRVVDICTGDLSAPASRKYDLEAWMPGRGEAGEWGEITSVSNCTDFQARRLGIRYRKGNTRGYLHTLNGTAIAVSRALVALLENYQKRDGSVEVPEVLRPYTGFDRIQPGSQ